MPINLNLPMPEPEPNVHIPGQGVADIPMAMGDYRFSGIRLTTNSDGDIIKTLYPVTQPESWSNRALIGIPGLILR
jgi:hypothetical protein